MTDVTQLTDEFLFDKASASAEAPIKISKGKSVVSVIDLQQGSYTSGIITLDATNQLNGANGFASLSEAYITVPYVVTLNNTGAGALTTTIANITQFIGSLKCNSAAIIDKVQIEMDGKTLVTPTNYLSHWNNFRAMSEWSDDDIKVHGSSAFMYPDDTHSIGYSSATIGSNSGDGYINNSNNLAAALASTNNNSTIELPVNMGFVKRTLVNPPVIYSGVPGSSGTDVNPFGWPSTAGGAMKQFTLGSGKGAIVVGSGAVGGTVATFYYLLKIRLIDIHPIFKTMDLLANPSLKLSLYVNTGSSDIALTSGGAMKLTSVNATQGNSCPFMLASAASGSGFASVVAGNATTLKLAWGVMGNALTATSIATAYYAHPTVRLWMPFYDLLPEKQLELVKSPKKVCRYLDVFTQSVKGATGEINGTSALGANFSIQISGNQRNCKYVALMPFATTKTSGTNGHFSTVVNVEQSMSPFESAPWTQKPGANIGNFNVQVGNQNVFNNPISQDFDGFYNEFSKISSLYGGQEHRLANGLIDEDKWAYAHRILVADVSRLTDEKVSQSIMISGTENSSSPSDFVVLCAYEKKFSLDRITGTIEML